MSWSTCTFASSMADDYLCILYYLRLGEKEVIILMTTYGAILGCSWSPQPFMTSVTQILPVPRLVKLISWWHRLTLVLVAHKSLSLICTQNQRIEVFHNHTSCVSRGFRFLPHARRLCQWNTGRDRGLWSLSGAGFHHSQSNSELQGQVSGLLSYPPL